MEHRYVYPIVKEIPIQRNLLDDDSFNSPPEPDEDYSVSIDVFAKRLVRNGRPLLHLPGQERDGLPGHLNGRVQPADVPCPERYGGASTGIPGPEDYRAL